MYSASFSVTEGAASLCLRCGGWKGVNLGIRRCGDERGREREREGSAGVFRFFQFIGPRGQGDVAGCHRSARGTMECRAGVPLAGPRRVCASRSARVEWAPPSGPRARRGRRRRCERLRARALSRPFQRFAATSRRVCELGSAADQAPRLADVRGRRGRADTTSPSLLTVSCLHSGPYSVFILFMLKARAATPAVHTRTRIA